MQSTVKKNAVDSLFISELICSLLVWQYRNKRYHNYSKKVR